MISLLFKRICLLLTICTALACTEAPEKAEEGGTCANSAECAEGQLCLKNECRDVDCLTSNDCDIEQYCSTEYACESGCENDNDCFAGDSATLPLKSVRPMVVETLNWIVRLVSFAMYQLVSATKMTSLTVGPVL